VFNGGFHLVVSRCLFQTHGQIDYRKIPMAPATGSCSP
jgi:hypothetical protein